MNNEENQWVVNIIWIR